MDSTIDRLQARRRNLPEQADLEDLEDRLGVLQRLIGEAQVVVDDIGIRQRRLEGEMDSLSRKIASEQAKLYSGAVASPKELSDLHREVESLKRRLSGLEDADLEVMEEQERAEKELARLRGEEEEQRLGIVEATARRDLASGELSSQLETARSDRGIWLPQVSPALLRQYEDLRASRGGVGIAAMVNGVCQGCHMRLPAQEVDRIRNAQGLVRCDECRRILVIL
ncbi:MAG: zinc ribbon domain-containing protein [Actinomycetota bacterium]